MTRAALAVLALASSVACGKPLVSPEDRPAGDGGVTDPPDASVPEAAAGDGASPGGPCSAGAHLMCDDFEDGLDPKWVQVGAKTAIEPSPRGGKMLVATLPAGGDADAYLSFATGSTKPLRVTFDVRVTDPGWTDPGGNANFAFVRFHFRDMSNDPITASAYLAPDGDGASVQMTAQRPTFTGGNHGAFALGVWRKVELTADFGAAANGLLTVEGVVTSTVTLEATPEGTPSLHIGLTRSNEPTPALRVEIDDVVVDEY